MSQALTAPRVAELVAVNLSECDRKRKRENVPTDTFSLFF